MHGQFQYPNPGFIWKLTPRKKELLENLSEEQKEDIVDGLNEAASESLFYCNALLPGQNGVIAKEAFRQGIEKHQFRTLYVFYRVDLSDILIRHFFEAEIEEVPIKVWMQINYEEAQRIKARWDRYEIGKHPNEILWSHLSS